jgi:hypothetical protein
MHGLGGSRENRYTTVTESSDLMAELRRGLSYLRREKKTPK